MGEGGRGRGMGKGEGEREPVLVYGKIESFNSNFLTLPPRPFQWEGWVFPRGGINYSRYNNSPFPPIRYHQWVTGLAVYFSRNIQLE